MLEPLDHAHIFPCPRVIDKYFKMTSDGPMTIGAADLGFYMSGLPESNASVPAVGLVDGWIEMMINRWLIVKIDR